MCFFSPSPPPPPPPPPLAPPAPQKTARGFNIFDVIGVTAEGTKFRRRPGTSRFKIPLSGLNLPT